MFSLSTFENEPFTKKDVIESKGLEGATENGHVVVVKYLQELCDN